MVYEKMHNIFDLAIRMQSGAEGISISDIMQQFNVSRRTAERMRNFIRERFPQLTETIGEHSVKRWHLPYGSLKNYISFSAEEIASLQNATHLLNHIQLDEQSKTLSCLLTKLKAMMRPEVCCRIETDTEIMQASEGFLFQPVPKQNLNPRHLSILRHAVTACRKIKLLSSHSPRRPRWRTLCPYAFIYGTKHCLIAYMEKKRRFCYVFLSDIIDLKETDSYFIRDQNFCLENFCHKNFEDWTEPVFDNEWLFDAKSASEAKNYIFHPRQTIRENSNGSLTVCFRAGGVLELDRHLYGWGTHVKVIKPKNWKQMVKEAKKYA